MHLYTVYEKIYDYKFIMSKDTTWHILTIRYNMYEKNYDYKFIMSKNTTWHILTIRYNNYKDKYSNILTRYVGYIGIAASGLWMVICSLKQQFTYRH